MNLSFRQEGVVSENRPKEFLTKDKILSHVSQEQIFEKYSGMQISNEMFCSKLRVDNSPGCRFNYGKTGILYHVDYSLGEYLDCFDYVGKMFQLNFIEAMNHIGADFGLLSSNVIDRVPVVPERCEAVKKASKERVPIVITEREWDDHDEIYWGSIFVSKEIFFYFDSALVEAAWIGDNLFYTYVTSNPCYAYRNIDGLKLYQPLTRDKGKKFRNNSSMALGWRQMMESTSKTLVITKSLKDVMVMYRFGVTAVAPQGEGMLFKESWMEIIREKFDNIYILMDNDSAGMRSMVKYRQAYPYIQCMMYPKELCKDTAEFVEKLDNNQAEVVYQRIEKGLTFKEIISCELTQ